MAGMRLAGAATATSAAGRPLGYLLGGAQGLGILGGLLVDGAHLLAGATLHGIGGVGVGLLVDGFHLGLLVVGQRADGLVNARHLRLGAIGRRHVHLAALRRGSSGNGCG